jgi:AcrR family transcriptional regulator
MPRIRRTAVEARELILDAAEIQLTAHGPDSLRLVQLAADVGMSHPAILHHFGSREGLVRAVVERTARRLEAQIFDALRGPLDENNAVNLLARLFSVLADQGHARLLVWLYLSGHTDPIGYGARMREIARTVHGLRRGRGIDAPEEDTLFTVLLAGIALFGDAIAGAPLRRSAGLGTDPEANARFLAWLARLLRDHLDAARSSSAGASGSGSRTRTSARSTRRATAKRRRTPRDRSAP